MSTYILSRTTVNVYVLLYAITFIKSTENEDNDYIIAEGINHTRHKIVGVSQGRFSDVSEPSPEP